jgi:hypothetical protein
MSSPFLAKTLTVPPPTVPRPNKPIFTTFNRFPFVQFRGKIIQELRLTEEAVMSDYRF